MAGSSNLDHAISALALMRSAQRAIEAALRLPTSDRAAVAEQIDGVRRSVDDVAASLAATVPGAQSLASAGHAIGGGLAERREFRALGAMISFFAGRGSQALGAVAGAAASIGDERDHSLALSERITNRLAEVGVATRRELARELEVDPRSIEFRDALERTLGTGHAEWYGSGTYGLPRAQLETMIARARAVSEEAALEVAGEQLSEPDETRPRSTLGLGPALEELRTSVDALRGAVASRGGSPPDAGESP